MHMQELTTSKTGMLDMGQLHTYKYNDDIFAKVTTLEPKNHGLVMFLDWSGSMVCKLKRDFKSVI